MKPSVFLAMPHRDGVSIGAVRGVMGASQSADVRFVPESRSCLTMCFNVLWCHALNTPDVTHFAMIHDDIGPEQGWLDVLLEELERTGADVVSAVSPIKDPRGLSSTAIRHPETGWLRRLTISETDSLPETFDATSAGFPGHTLLVNTGLWVCRFDRSWVERITFKQKDGKYRGDDGKWRPTMLTEDWLFSLDLAEMGIKAMATRRVKLRHAGLYAFPNSGGWGQWKTDEGQSAPLMEVEGE